MKCLVTGVAGFIGSQLAEALIQKQYSVIGVDCFTDYYSRDLKLSNLAELRSSKDFEFAEVDLASADLSSYLEGVEVVFHLAAQPGVRASWGESFSSYTRDNIAATQRLLEASKGGRLKRFVYSSSSSVYGDAERIPTPEDTKPSPVSPYGATKLEAEYLCEVYRKNFMVPTVILRYFTVYGPRQRPDMAFSRFIEAIGRGEEIPVFGDGTQGRDFTFVSDTVAGTMLSIEARPGSIYNVGTGTVVSLNRVLSLLGQILGKAPRVRRIEKSLGDVKTTCADTSKIREDLGFEPKVGLETGLRRQVAASLAR